MSDILVAFSDLIRAAEVGLVRPARPALPASLRWGAQVHRSPLADDTVAQQEMFAARVQTDNLVRAVQAFLSLLADLKQALVVNDFDAIVAHQRQALPPLQTAAAASRDGLAALHATLAAHLRHLEALRD